jgi:cell division protein FtsX
MDFDLNQLKTFNLSKSYADFTPVEMRNQLPTQNWSSKLQVQFKLLAQKAIESSKMIPIQPSKQNANEYIYRSLKRANAVSKRSYHSKKSSLDELTRQKNNQGFLSNCLPVINLQI